MKYYLWLFENAYGYLLGWPRLRLLHHLLLNLALHGLGYDNVKCSGEDWFIRKVLAKHTDAVYVDVGANVGQYTEKLLRYTSAKIYAFEPSESSFAVLKEKFAAHTDRVKLMHMALGDHDGSGTLFSKEPLSQTATLDEGIGKGAACKEIVTMRRLDAVVAEQALRRIDCVKIDTEGFEPEVLRGMSETLAQLKPTYIQFEFNLHHLHRGYSLYELTKLLPGYKMYRLLPHGMLSVDPRCFADNIYMFSNYIAIREH